MRDTKLEKLRSERIQAMADWADEIEADRRWISDLLLSVCNEATALDEVDKTLRALRSYRSELPALDGRHPRGTVAVMLPFNNPLYSLVLYSCGAALAGNRVIVRPSSITAPVVEQVSARYAPHLADCGVQLQMDHGDRFIRKAVEDSSVTSLIFTGNYENLVRIRADFPTAKQLIYCGSGINPFVIGSRAVENASDLDYVSNLAIRSKLYNSGQDCLCTERIYVHKTHSEEFIEHLRQEIRGVTVGEFGDRDAQVVPLLGGLGGRARRLVEQHSDVTWFQPNPIRNSNPELVTPMLAQVPLGHALLKQEKFAPIFVVAAFEDDSELELELACDWRFGAVVTGDFDHPLLADYPHVTQSRSVIEYESDDAHKPFGGRGRSGFVSEKGETHDGPILYSVETSLIAK